MQIWPAIDLRGGRCVRLVQGDYDRETVYDDDPAAVARRWVEQGAEYLHLVDLDGARAGRLENRAAVKAVLNVVDVPCELGGGIRDEEAIDQLLQMGLHRLVIGTRALKEPDWFRKMCDRFPQKLVLGVDARDGWVATDGWLQTSKRRATDLASQFDSSPIAAVIYTDIATDGMLSGPNVAAVREMCQCVDHPIIASGGVSNAQDVANLAATPVTGCIIGKALYEGRLTITDALAATAVAEPSPHKTH